MENHEYCDPQVTVSVKFTTKQTVKPAVLQLHGEPNTLCYVK